MENGKNLTKKELIEILSHSDLDYLRDTGMVLVERGERGMYAIDDYNGVEFLGTDEINQRYVTSELKMQRGSGAGRI